MSDTAPIIITGGGRRLGLACALALKQQHNHVLVTYRSSLDNLALLDAHHIHHCQVDFADPASLTSFIAQVQDEYGAVRALVHNASDWVAEHGNQPAEVFDRMFHIHAKVPYLLNLAFAPLLEKAAEANGHADIVHISDFVVERGSDKHMAYAASKAALNNLTLSFAKRLAPKVKVNAIAPALLLFNPNDDEAYRQKALAKSLMGIEPGEQEMIDALKLLLTSRYITGRTLSLDGGRHLK